MKIGTELTEDGWRILVKGRAYSMGYPGEVWRRCPEGLRRRLLRNLAPLKTLHLERFLQESEFDYDTAAPDFLFPLYNSLLKMVPFCAERDGLPAADMVRNFLNIDMRFATDGIAAEPVACRLEAGAVLSMSFGKDSLLTYAMARELGLETTLVISSEPSAPLERAHKLRIADAFSRETGTPVWRIENDTADLHEAGHWGSGASEWGIFHQMSELLLLLIPFAVDEGRRYIVFGNEKSCDDFYFTNDGYRAFPVYDQSSEWVAEQRKMAAGLVRGLDVFSLIEPIHEIAIIRVLHQRYPRLAKYQMSCFPDEKGGEDGHYWCQSCSKCARTYIYMLANDLDPASIGFNRDLLSAGNERLYSLFSGADAVGYDASMCNRDEQLLAFLLAYELGRRGAVMSLFEEHHLAEALRRREELWREYMGIHPFVNTPEWLRPGLTEIYQAHGLTVVAA